MGDIAGTRELEKASWVNNGWKDWGGLAGRLGPFFLFGDDQGGEDLSDINKQIQISLGELGP